MLSLFRSKLLLATPAKFAASNLAPSVALAANFATTSINSEAAKKTKKSTKSKKVSVKRAVLPYMFYVKDFYAKNGDELKSLTFAEKSKYIQNKWNGLTEGEKAPYVALHEEDLKRNLADKAKAAAEAPPKRPLTSYMAWLSQERSSLASSNPHLSTSELGKLAGERWRELSEYEKSHYAESSKTEMEAWKVEYAKWKESKSL